ncbi:unknown protein [Seminavis robusta]|uniref:Uncharacterized protein n=1 Tax=Seminavis robusta TaxID=568900 RepID=A0A9N8HC29_9STRA|nr:unknown protein [Seminavis robusta]|eukprot:Sro283_g107710.1 n/a (339) ;mRNA; r:30336-31450
MMRKTDAADAEKDEEDDLNLLDLYSSNKDNDEGDIEVGNVKKKKVVVKDAAVAGIIDLAILQQQDDHSPKICLKTSTSIPEVSTCNAENCSHTAQAQSILDTPVQYPEFTRHQGIHPAIPGAIAVDGPGFRDDIEDESDDGIDEDRTSDVIIAHPVHEDEVDGLLVLQNAVPHMSFQRIKEYWRRRLFVALSIQTIVGMAAVAIILAVFFLVVWTRHSSSPLILQQEQQNGGRIQSPSSAPIMATTPAPTTTLLDVLHLPNYTLRAIMDDPESPQSKANEWLINAAGETSIHLLPEWKLRQLFVLVTFYHSTKGDYWVKKHCWLDWKNKRLPLGTSSH